MKRFLSIVSAVIVIFSFFSVAVSAATLPKAKSNFFVNDFANVISDSDESKMQQQGEALYKASGAQVVVVTVDDMDGEDIESYSLELARSWGIGSKKNSDGVLLLLSVKERAVRIEVGYGLEGALNDSKTGRILDTYGIEYFKNNDFSTGLTAVYNSLVNEVYIEKGLQPDENYKSIAQIEKESEPSPKEKLVGYGIVALIILFIFLVTFKRRGKGNHYNSGGPYYGGFGGFGGGSSDGGGFSSGGFSGGGGSFGGGGSSRGF